MSLFNYECDDVKSIIEEVSPNYPQLTTYEKEWLFFNKYHYIPGIPVELEYETVKINPSGSVSNAIPYRYKSAILTGSTKYRDIDTGEVLDTFNETKNLEMVSVKMPVLKTSNSDSSKTNILTVNEPVELRGIGDVKDELNLLTGELTQKLERIVFNDASYFNGTRYTDLGNTIKWQTNDRFIQFNSLKTRGKIMSNAFISNSSDDDYEHIRLDGASPKANLILYVNKATASNYEELNTYLQNNPLTIVAEKTEESIKTVDLTRLTKPYEGTNHYQLESNIPCEAILEVPVVSTGNQTLKEINE